MLRRIIGARRGWYIGGGVFGARERDTQRPSYADFFGSFLFGDKKEHCPAYQFHLRPEFSHRLRLLKL